LRAATVEDVIVRMRDGGYSLYAMSALGWGMGSAQLDIDKAVQAAITAGLIRTEQALHTHKTMLALTDAGRAFPVCTGWRFEHTQDVEFPESAARCSCWAPLVKRQRPDGEWYWEHTGAFNAKCPPYLCACGEIHHAPEAVAR
jgi:hypothetical protein